jgi:putative tryptophan/tyrosine transport system substrate-binding protein
MQRREFIAGIGGAAIWSLAAGAQQPALPVVGFVTARSAGASVDAQAAFRKGLGQTGHAEGQNVTVEYHWLDGHFDRLRAVMDDLVRRRVAVIAAPGSLPTALAAKAATATIPIVFGTGADPVQAGLVASLNRPGGNVTGVSVMNVELGGKRFGLLHELLPGAARFAVLVNPNNPLTESFVTDVRTAASAIGRQVELLNASTIGDIDTAFAGLVQNRADALLVGPDTLFRDRRVQLVILAARHAVPTIYGVRELAEAGGLMSYGSNFTDLFRQTGMYTGRVLKGEKPAELPILRATKFEFIINLQTAKALGLEIPPGVLAIADEVIE